MAEEIRNEQEQPQEQSHDYEEPSLTDLEDVSGGGAVCVIGIVNAAE